MPRADRVEPVESFVRDALRSVRRGWLRIASFTLICVATAVGLSTLQTPVYQAAASMYVTSGAEASSLDAYVGGLASVARVKSYASLALSDSVLTRAIQDAQLDVSVDQARSMLTATIDPDTVIINLVARDKDRSVATRLLTAVANTTAEFVARIETPADGRAPLAKATVVSPAQLAPSPVSPRYFRQALISLFVGLFFSISFIVFRGRFSTRIDTAEDINRVLDAPLLAQIPRAASLRSGSPVDFGHGGDVAAEQFRALRTSMSFANVDAPPRLIMVTSPLPEEGKTTVSANLALAYAEAGRRVVLVDADLRRPRLHLMFDCRGDIGLTNAVRGDAQVFNFLQPTSHSNLQLLAAGPAVPNPGELLQSQRTGNTLWELSDRFDVVVVDLAPVIPVADATSAVQWADAVIVVVRASKTRAADLASTASELMNASASIVGVVLNESASRALGYDYGLQV